MFHLRKTSNRYICMWTALAVVPVCKNSCYYIFCSQDIWKKIGRSLVEQVSMLNVINYKYIFVYSNVPGTNLFGWRWNNLRDDNPLVHHYTFNVTSPFFRVPVVESCTYEVHYTFHMFHRLLQDGVAGFFLYQWHAQGVGHSWQQMFIGKEDSTYLCSQQL